jgi:hypothetical protein
VARLAGFHGFGRGEVVPSSGDMLPKWFRSRLGLAVGAGASPRQLDLGKPQRCKGSFILEFWVSVAVPSLREIVSVDFEGRVPRTRHSPMDFGSTAPAPGLRSPVLPFSGSLVLPSPLSDLRSSVCTALVRWRSQAQARMPILPTLPASNFQVAYCKRKGPRSTPRPFVLG